MNSRPLFARFPAALLAPLTALFIAAAPLAGQTPPPAATKVGDGVVYRDDAFYSAFPSVVKARNGDLLVAFRRAPNRSVFQESGYRHVDPNSYLVLVRSTDGGATWSKEPQLIHAHPFGGSQDPCLLGLRDGSLLCTSYAWALVRPEGLPRLKTPHLAVADGFVFLGGYLLRSPDAGRTWEGPLLPPHIPPEVRYDALGQPLRAYNRGALCEGREGRLYWVVAANDRAGTKKTSIHLLTSTDGGVRWDYACPVAADDRISFNETSILQTPKGDLVAFARSEDFDDHACLARSVDGGRSFQPWQDLGFQGHPLHALPLRDGRVLLTYGYRHPPYGIRARLLDAECRNASAAPEIILRDDGGSRDVGYPWSIELDDGRVLVVYYFNLANGPRHIASTLLTLR